MDPGRPRELARGAAFGLAAAALFGASAPLAKLLLPVFAPLSLAALLYLGAGAAMFVFLGRRHEARLQREDVPALLAVALLGGALGPCLMLAGLERLSGTAGALLLNLEAPFTMLVAVVLFREHMGRRALAASALIVAGAAVLGWAPGSLAGDPAGVALVAGACLCWALDNNLTQRLTVRDPVAIVRYKALGAGTLSLVLALVTAQPFAQPELCAAALALGAVSYGASILLDAHALRLLGAAREAAFFATAPFAGALLAMPLLGERPGPSDLAALALMLAGVAVLLRERHTHVHTHEALEHEHLHVHDEHHRHAHEGPVTEPHSHRHAHEPLTHEHPHVPDAHHRHRHS